MPEPKAQLIDPQGPIDVPGMQVTGVTTATGGFVGAVQGAATGLASTTANLSVGIVTATKFQGNTTGNVSGLADGTNINVGIITSTSFTGDLVGNAAGLSTTTANIKAGILSATSFAGNFTGVASGITGTPNIVVGIMTGTLKGDGSSLTGIAATNWITNNVTANSSTTTVDLSDGNVVKFTQSADTTVSFANTGTSNIVTFIRSKDDTSTERTITWPSAVKWDGGSAPTLNTASTPNDVNVITLLTRDEGVTWYGWQNISFIGGYKMFIWGANTYGSLGQNAPQPSYQSSPIEIPGTTWNVPIRNTGSNNILGAIKTDGTLWVWGSDAESGETGLNHRTRISSPTQIPGTTWSNVCSGENGAMASKTDGTIWKWGKNNIGQLGLNDLVDRSSPTQIPGTSWTTKIAVGQLVSYAIKTDGTLWAWGSNNGGTLGTNTSDNVHQSSPIQIPGTTWANVISSNPKKFTLATKTDGTLWSWGYNTHGQLGQNEGAGNDKKARSSPTQIPGTDWNTGYSALHAGDNESYAIKTDGTLWSWGSNAAGQLGLNNVTTYSSPVQVPGTTWSKTIGRVSLKTDNTLWAWGSNTGGELGLNQPTSTAYSSPVQIPGTKWTDLGGTGQGAGQPLALQSP